MNHLSRALLFAVFAVAFPAAAQESPTMCTMQYQPVCGTVPSTCTGEECVPEYKTYGNACVMGAEGGTFVHEGECIEETATVTPEETIIAEEHIELAEQVLAVLEEEQPESFWSGLWSRFLAFFGFR